MLPKDFDGHVAGGGRVVSAPSPGDDLRSKFAVRLRGQDCTRRFFEG